MEDQNIVLFDYSTVYLTLAAGAIFFEKENSESVVCKWGIWKGAYFLEPRKFRTVKLTHLLDKQSLVLF